MSSAEYRANGKPSRNKYGARKTVVDGITFDSKAEAAYYASLRLRYLADEVVSVELQKPYPLTINGFVVGVYKADFAFHDVPAGKYRVIDVKGKDTPLSKLKRKMVKAIYGLDVELAK